MELVFAAGCLLYFSSPHNPSGCSRIRAGPPSRARNHVKEGGVKVLSLAEANMPAQHRQEISPVRLWRHWWTRLAITPASLVTFLLVGLVAVSASVVSLVLSQGADPSIIALHLFGIIGIVWLAAAQWRALSARKRGGEGRARQSCPARARAGQAGISGGELASSRGPISYPARAGPGLHDLPVGCGRQSYQLEPWRATGPRLWETRIPPDLRPRPLYRGGPPGGGAGSRASRGGGARANQFGPMGGPEGRQPLLGLDVHRRGARWPGTAPGLCQAGARSLPE